MRSTRQIESSLDGNSRNHRNRPAADRRVNRWESNDRAALGQRQGGVVPAGQILDVGALARDFLFLGRVLLGPLDQGTELVLVPVLNSQTQAKLTKLLLIRRQLVKLTSSKAVIRHALAYRALLKSLPSVSLMPLLKPLVKLKSVKKS